MRPRRRTLALVKLPICLFLLVVPLRLGYGVPRALADSFTFTTIDAPGGNKGSQASGINIAGQIVGAFETVGLTGECMDVGECFAGPSPDCLGEPQPPIEHAFCGPDVDNTYCIFDDYFSGYCIVGESFHGYLRSPDGSSFTTIDVPGAFYTYAKGVNGAGQIVGRFEPGGAEVAFRRDTDGSFTTIDVPGACCSGAEGINDSGQIVGHFTDNTSYTTHGFLRSPDGSNFTIIDVPGASSTYAYGVNGAGQVVGSFQDARGGHGFLRDTDGSFTTIDVPGAMSSEANGINATGQIVGTFQDATGDHGFLRGTDASFTTIHVPGALGTAAAGINDTGQIAGTFTDASNVGHGFVASPFGPSSGGGAAVTVKNRR